MIKSSGSGISATALNVILVVFILFTAIGSGRAIDETHLDKNKLPQGCSSCHKGHGKRATVMLDLPKDELCFKCHGPLKKGIKGEANTDIYTVILKRSNHTIIQTSQYHVPGENLPEREPSTPRHVSCYDCHNTHFSTKDKMFKGVRGYSGKGTKIRAVQKEYEICYNCHSDSANLPPNESNIARKFDPGTVSFHPVETYGKNRNVPSLKAPLSINTVITCSDCHGNDDKTGPRGPHGSNYNHLLTTNYTTESGPESPFAYELCYGCHNRNSILNDESFKAHKRHILYGNISCFACHDAHGSATYSNLINFDTRVVSPNSIGQLTYWKLVPGRPRCFLSCHRGAQNFDHLISATQAQYCVDTNCPPGW